MKVIREINIHSCLRRTPNCCSAQCFRAEVMGEKEGEGGDDIYWFIVVLMLADR